MLAFFMYFFFFVFSIAIFTLEMIERANVSVTTITSAIIYGVLHLCFTVAFSRLLCLMVKYANLELRRNIVSIVAQFLCASVVVSL